MTGADLYTLAPLLILAATPVVVMLAIAFYRDHWATVVLTVIGLVAALISLLLTGSVGPAEVTGLLILDGYARFFIGLIIAATLAVALLSYGFLRGIDDQPDEYYLLLLLATLGSAVLAASKHFTSFFLGLEILSVSLYALIAYPRRLQNQIEASLKYLILAGASAAFLVFGLALVYAATGTMDFAAAVSARPATWLAPQVLFAGWGFILVGIGFKLAVVPFHLWTPDVYEGAPAPVTAYVATVSKGAMFALLLRLFAPAEVHREMPLALVFTLIAIASMLFGNLAALLQSNVKRILAYSSIAHLGYLLVAFLASGERAVVAVAFYLTAYFVTMLGALGIVTVFSSHEKEADQIEDYRGLFWRRPWLAAVLTVALLSLAGIPLTVGFVGKFYLLMAGVGATLWALVFFLVVSSAIGLFYYLRVIVALYMQPPADAPIPEFPPVSLSAGAAIAVVTVLLIWLGIYPDPVIAMIEAMVRL
ncbi:MAG: NADH-quinone oxidoreductase subunit N [Deltaproteobacteria bacterium]|nr:NADH-quinone oxidoreductase subunit N [Deltaproteobacteria bacterium]